MRHAHRKGKRILSLIGAILFPLFSVAQTQDGVEPETPATSQPKSDTIVAGSPVLSAGENEEKDSSTFFNHLYYLSFSGGNSYSYQNLGSVNPIIDAEKHNVQPGFPAFDQLLNFPLRRYNSDHSYIAYLKGSKLEQAFCAGFNQRVFKRFVLEGAFRTINSPGFFINQQNKVLNYQGALSYESRNNIYKAKVEFLPATINQGVNGGIISDTLFNKLANNEGKSLNVNLPTAAIKFRNKSLTFQQDYNPGYDSLSNIKWFINHDLNYHNISYIYNSQAADTAFYDTVIYDSTVTSDSMHYYSVSNFIAPGIIYKSSSKNEVRFNLLAGLKHSRYHTFDSTQELDVQMVGFGINFNSKQFSSEIKGIYSISNDYDDSGLELAAFLKLNPANFRVNVEADLKYLQEYPSVISGHYVSNHFYWTNQFNNSETQYIKLKFNAERKIWEVSGAVYNLKNFIYFN
jgi:hypothetical protein